MTLDKRQQPLRPDATLKAMISDQKLVNITETQTVIHLLRFKDTIPVRRNEIGPFAIASVAAAAAAVRTAAAAVTTSEGAVEASADSCLLCVH